MRSATGAYQHIFVLVLAIHKIAKNLFVLLGCDIRQFFAASSADHEEHVQDPCAEGVGPFHDCRQFLIVHGLRTEVNLELQTIAFAGLDAGQCAGKGTGDTTELIVLVRIKRVDADADAHDTDLDQRFCHAIVDQHAIGAEHDDEAEPHGMSGDVQDVGTHQRFSAGDHQQASFVHLGDLIDETEALFRTELIRPAAGFGRSIEITVITLEVAALGEVQRDQIGFKVIDRATVVRRSRGEVGEMNFEICCWRDSSLSPRNGKLRTGSDFPITGSPRFCWRSRSGWRSYLSDCRSSWHRPCSPSPARFPQLPLPG